MKYNGRVYIAIDLKSFYASAECVERGYDPLNTNLTVADPSRSDKTICLAVSPSLKAVGVGGRCRLFELKEAVRKVNAQRRLKAPNRCFNGKSIYASELEKDASLELDFVIAPPQMEKYEKISSKIYSIYLHHVASEDIHVYSIDEVFIDATDYLKQANKNAHDFAMMLIQEVLKETGITATAGIGTNLYLCKIAMDIVAKKMKPDKDGVRIAWLTEEKYKKTLWDHVPITDFWRVGSGYSKTLAAHNMFTMGDIALCSEINEDLLYELFGVNAELLIDHAWGYEPVTMKEIKAYKPSSNSLSIGQVLTKPYNYEMGRTIVNEMAELLAFDLLEKKLVTKQIVLDIGYDVENNDYKGIYKVDHYGRKIPRPTHGTINLESYTNLAKIIIEYALTLMERICDDTLNIRRVNIVACNVIKEEEAKRIEEKKVIQMSLFDDFNDEKEDKVDLEKERKAEETILNIRKRFGKNAILRGVNLKEGATTMERNRQIGGHKAYQDKKIEVRTCNKEDLKAIHEIRNKVFVKEQNIDEAIECDEIDAKAIHVICTYDDLPIGTGRIYFDREEAHLGRICVLKRYRGLGAGKKILLYLLSLGRKNNCKMVTLNSQLAIKDFYLKYGFVPLDEPFIIAGISHIKMIRSLK